MEIIDSVSFLGKSIIDPVLRKKMTLFLFLLLDLLGFPKSPPHVSSKGHRVGCFLERGLKLFFPNMKQTLHP